MTTGCLHCGGPLDGSDERFCCAGCEAAYALLTGAGLDRYYALRDGPGAAVTATTGALEQRQEPWLVQASEALLAAGEGLTVLELDVQGLHCAACVWVIEQLFSRKAGAAGIVVNPGTGKLVLEVRRGFALGEFAGELGRLGYRLGPSSKQADRAAMRSLLLRIGVCAALAMNVMIFSVALYCGLDEGPVHALMLGGSWALTAAAVAVGGTPFFKSAWASVRSRALHLDLPIALGIALAFGGSTWSMLTQGGRASYFDTVASFVTLMLVGRLLQERILEQNRRALLADDGLENQLCTVVEGELVRVVRVGELSAGALLLLRPGDLVPVAAELRSPAATRVSREWITGESSEHTVRAGHELEAGSFHAGPSAATAVARGDFASSPLADLLRRPRAVASDRARQTPLWQALARGYVAATLTLAAASGLVWATVGRSPGRALEVVVAILVVTCPCAFGIAVPVAYEIVQARLRRQGVFVRSASLLERAVRVRQVVFDKTGTLTLGSLELAEPGALAGLSEPERRALGQMVVRSSHPKSRAVAAALGRQGGGFDAGCEAQEYPGQGIELRTGTGQVYRLGARGWAGEGGEQADLVFGQQQASGEFAARLALRTREVVRREARGELARLAGQGYAVHLLSGDVPARVEALAAELGIEPERARASQSPQRKRAYIEQVGADSTLMVGDGVNDAAALSAALCSATPAGDLPYLPARTDVYIQGALVSGVRGLLGAARRLDRVVREAVAFGVIYNVVAVAAACAGCMSPLLAAVLMPLSSLGVVAWVATRLSARRADPSPAVGTVVACPVVPRESASAAGVR